MKLLLHPCMSGRRALVECVVLSVQDACVFYPCCKGCFSRVDVEQQDTTRCRCSKCGYSCLREQVDYRYRLSLKVSRNGSIFGVTVFGSCLNPFFGIHASGLQRLVEKADGASTKSTLLGKAVTDCFIGRHFIFGIKGGETENGPWLGRPVANGSNCKEAAHFIASQMILPIALGLEGCTVVSYYRLLLQKAAQYEQRSTDPSKNSRPPATILLPIPQHFPASSFNNGTLSLSGLLSQSPQSSQNQDSTLTPTPPWQQSLGLVTSSAEQEEGCSTQEGGDENSRQTDNNNTPHHSQRCCLDNHKVTEERALSPFLSLECNPFRSPSFAKYPRTCVEKSVGNSPNLKTSVSPPTPHHDSKRFSTRQCTKSFLSSSLAWEDLPFSESLSEFLLEENKDIVSETELQLNVQNQEETARNNLTIRPQDRNVSRTSTPVCQSNMQIIDCHSQTLRDITIAPNGDDRYDLSDKVYNNPVRPANSNQARNICSHECNQEDQRAHSLSFESEEEKQLEVDAYNCSADLFGSSLLIDMDSNKFNTPAETVRTNTDACRLFSTSKKQHQMRETATHSPPDKKKLRSAKCNNRDSLIPTDFDFIPPSQSTPIVKVAAVMESPASLTLSEISQDSSAFYRNLPDVGSNKTGSTTSSLCKSNHASANQVSQCCREFTKENLVCRTTSSRQSHRFTPKRRFWKPNKHKNLSSVQRSTLNTRLTRRISHKCDSSDCGVTVCDYEDKEAIVPPTPAAETQLSMKLRRRRQAYSWEGQQGGDVNCKRTLLDQTLTSQTGNCDSKTVDEGSQDGSNRYLLHDENEACDLSRDLFSDSM
ncbi:uncharacterized protein ddias [Centropristis striata]|uniref:uncharacterized protein ddias n=1 Tax=Centropristis striata TaxID=184440 RepID=UPI0027E0B330|nr:uncharacterized protein ddias [Centropristis striata]